MKFTKGNNLSKGRPKGSKNVRTTELQKAMGHSSLKASLTYLRGLEIAKLKEEDMPMI